MAATHRTLKIQVASDLHLETLPPSLAPAQLIKPSADILVLAGDIGQPALNKENGWDKFEEFLRHQSARFERVFLVPGNHEFWNEVHADKPQESEIERILATLGGDNVENKGKEEAVVLISAEEIRSRIQKLCDALHNVVLLDRRSVVHNGVKFIGATLWSFVPEESREALPIAWGDFSHIFVHDVGSERWRDWQQNELQRQRLISQMEQMNQGIDLLLGRECAQSASTEVSPTQQLLSPASRSSSAFNFSPISSPSRSLHRHSRLPVENNIPPAIPPPVRAFTMNDMLQWHRQDLEFIQRELQSAAEAKVPCVLVTHHAPTFHAVPARKMVSSLRYGYATDLEHMFASSHSSEPQASSTASASLSTKSGPIIWVHGHTHLNYDQVISATRVVCNSRGTFNSPSEGKKFDHACVVEEEVDRASWPVQPPSSSNPGVSNKQLELEDAADAALDEFV